MTRDRNAAAPFTGVAVALVTLFDEYQQLDASGTADHASRLVDLGMQTVLVAGSSGEAAALTDAERQELIAAVVKSVDGAAVVVAGVGAPSTEDACRLTEDARLAGSDCILSPPAKSHEVALHYKSVKRAAGDLPVLAYHWPARYPPGINIEDIDALPIDGCKDTEGDPKRLLDEVTKSRRPVYTGSSSLVLMCSGIGGTGAILGIANACPELAIAAFNGDGAAQRELHVLRDTVRGLPSVKGLKQLTAERFGTSMVTRT